MSEMLDSSSTDPTQEKLLRLLKSNREKLFSLETAEPDEPVSLELVEGVTLAQREQIDALLAQDASFTVSRTHGGRKSIIPSKEILDNGTVITTYEGFVYPNNNLTATHPVVLEITRSPLEGHDIPMITSMRASRVGQHVIGPVFG